MKRSIDSTLLAVFRLFIAARLLLAVFSLLPRRTGLSPRLARLQPYPSLGVIETGLLLVYLSLPGLQTRLGRAYLPIAVALATVAPILENFLSIDQRAARTELESAAILTGQWQLIILLLVPLIMVSWTSSFKTVSAYCIATGLLDLVLGIFLFLGEGRGVLVINVLVFRTIVFLMVGYVIVRLASEQRAQNQQLASANLRLAGHANTVEQLAVSHERNRLAREMHDTLAHTLSGVAVQLEAVNSLWESNTTQAHAMLAQALTATRQGLQETRRAIQALRAAPLEDLGLALALRSLAQSTSGRAGLALEAHIATDLPVLPAEVEHTLYRIAEETLQNVLRHSGAKSLTVTLEAQGGGLWLCIQDDGRGFQQMDEDVEDHFGLRGMRERAEAIGARLVVHSQPEAGTEILVQWPTAGREVL